MVPGPSEAAAHDFPGCASWDPLPPRLRRSRKLGLACCWKARVALAWGPGLVLNAVMRRVIHVISAATALLYLAQDLQVRTLVGP